jgi:hypothetical protein
MPPLVPDKQRQFAVEVVRRLRAAGFEAYWAGGCVRDQLLGRAPKDYDVATAATPPQIRELFGHRQTLAIGAAFGVITVKGPRGAGTIEVATFREDSTYSDGRHPDSVTFSSAQADASRRDFTINGVFYDPLENRVIDFVGGQEDLHRGVLRAIGRPRERFAEDKLRMLRAVRFAASFDFALDPETLAAACQMADEITVVSPERIAAEMRRLLVESGRATGVRLLLATGLAAVVLPEIVPADDDQRHRLDHTLEILDRLGKTGTGSEHSRVEPAATGGGEVPVPVLPDAATPPSFPLALATLLHEATDAAGVVAVGRRWRLSNDERERAAWLVEHCRALHGARAMRWSALQPLLIAPDIEELLSLVEAIAPGSDDVVFCREMLRQPPESLDPPPLVTGDDLLRLGVPTGPQYAVLLQRIRDAQLDAEIHTRDEALALVGRLAWQDNYRQ